LGTSTDWEHEIHLPVEPLSASRARAFVCRHLVEHRLLQLVAPIRLVASELATHAIIHSDTPFTVTLSMTDDVVTLSVHDNSRAPLARSATSGLNPRGHEAAIVGVLSQQWGVEAGPSHGKTVWAAFPRPRTPPGHP
jgi:hypothetical protein